MYKVKFYRTQRGKYPVVDFIEELDKKSQAKIYRYLTLLQEQGPDLPRPYADQVKGKIRELRVKTFQGNIRIFYFFFLGDDIVMLHAFKKKTQKLAEREIKKAQQNMSVFLLRHERGEF